MFNRSPLFRAAAGVIMRDSVRGKTRDSSSNSFGPRLQ